MSLCATDQNETEASVRRTKRRADESPSCLDRLTMSSVRTRLVIPRSYMRGSTVFTLTEDWDKINNQRFIYSLPSCKYGTLKTNVVFTLFCQFLIFHLGSGGSSI